MVPALIADAVRSHNVGLAVGAALTFRVQMLSRAFDGSGDLGGEAQAGDDGLMLARLRHRQAAIAAVATLSNVGGGTRVGKLGHRDSGKLKTQRLRGVRITLREYGRRRFQ